MNVFVKIMRNMIMLTAVLILCCGCAEKSPSAAGTAQTGDVSGDYRDYPVSDASIFTIGPSGTGAEITGCKRDIKDKVIVVPERIGGADIVAIGPGAFTEVPAAAIVLPDSVKTIGASAFTGLENLKYVYFGSGLRSTGNMMFNYCPALEKIELPDGTERINGYLAVRCAGLKEVIVPASVTKIEGRMLEDFDFDGVVRTPSGSEAEKNALEAGIKVENTID